MINFQRPAFPALNNFCNKHLYTKPLSQFTAVHVNFILVGLVSHSSLAIFRSHADIYSLYQLKVYFMFVFLDCVCCREDFIGQFQKISIPNHGRLPCFNPPLPSEIPKCVTPPCPQNSIIVNPRLPIRISGFLGVHYIEVLSIHFIVILAKLKKIVHYTQDFVI